VEPSQLAVIASAFSPCAKKCYRRVVVILVSALITATGIFWTVQRILLTTTRNQDLALARLKNNGRGLICSAPEKISKL
jgi:hypothetical protein